MAITTTLTIESPLEGNGFASLVAGQQSGAPSRQVSIQAFPAAGYVFDRWEVVTDPAILDVFAAVAASPVGSITEVCSSAGALGGVSYQNIARELFTDGTMLYLDMYGNTPAPTGYWGAGDNTYYFWDGGKLPQLQTCATTSGGGGGGGGGSEETNSLTGGGSSGGSGITRDDIRFI